MYKQIYTTKSKTLPFVLFTITLGLCLLSVPSIINMTSFVWIYELTVIVLVAAAVYLIMKKGCYTYIYHIIDDEIVVTLALGSKESVLCSLEIRDIIEMTESSKIKQLKEQYSCKFVYKCLAKADIPKSTAIIFREEQSPNDISILAFVPDKEFLQFLNEKRLDIQAKV